MDTVTAITANPTNDAFTIDATERELRLVVNHSMTGISWLTSEGVFAQVRNGYADLLGYAPDELLGRSWSSTVPQGDHDKAIAAVHAMLENGRAEVDLQALRKDGSTFDKHLLLVKTFDASGRHNGHFCFMRDVSARKTVEQALERSRQFSDRLLEVIQDGVAVVDADGRHIMVNESLTRMTGFGRDELVGSGLPHLYWPEEHSEAIMAAYRSQPHGVVRHELIFRRKNGQRFPVLVSPSTTVDDQGNTIHIATVSDMSELKEAERRLIESERLKTMGTLAGGLAHDLNNLLTPILGYADALTKGLLDVDDAARAIRGAAASARQLIGDVLQFSRGHDRQPGATSVTRAVEIALQFARTSLPTNVIVQTQYESVRDAVVCAESEMQQVVMNLIANAGQAMRDGGTLTVRVHNPARDRVVLAIADTGPGIGPGPLARIFEPFYTTKPAGEGTGLGLATVKRVVTAIGGSVSVESQVGAGTTFAIDLPLAPSQAGREAGDSPEPDGLDGDEPLTVLLVDDQEGVLKVTRSMLEHLGHRVEAFTDPGAAVARGLGGIDLVLTDYRMEGMTGLDMVEAAGRPDVPVVLMSGDRATLGPLPDFVVARLDKPFTMADLRRVIETARGAPGAA